MNDLHRNLADNIRRLREAHSHSQQRMADLSGIPRPTWASLESGAANPTMTVLNKAAVALQVSIEELVGAPRSEVKHFRAAEIRERRRHGVRVRSLVPEAIPGIEISRMEFKPGARMIGVPHTRGTREYLSCERGSIELVATGERWHLQTGDMLVFLGDQHHSYHNPDKGHPAVAIAVVCFARG